MAAHGGEREQKMPSLNYSIKVETLSSKAENYHLLATSEERAAIAKRLNLISLEYLKASIELLKKGHIYLTGKMIADVTQQCVRTLVSFPVHLEIEIDEEFTLAPKEQEKEVEFNSEDLVEPLEGDTLDLGEIVIQLLSLNLNPYPVAPESAPIDYKEKDTSSPFEVLKKKD